MSLFNITISEIITLIVCESEVPGDAPAGPISKIPIQSSIIGF